ncbi:hypothetical protein AGMMS49587_09660 [Spirochaetia bacterium]|nr:hypothetical protein AGMMS49587_09660 [Spirochaetia bacterium]
MKKNQLWMTAVVFLLAVSLFVMGCKTDESAAPTPTPASVLAEGLADDLTAAATISGTVSVSGAVVSVDGAGISGVIPTVPAGVTLSFTGTAPEITSTDDESIIGSAGSKVIFNAVPLTGSEAGSDSNFYADAADTDPLAWNAISEGLYTWDGTRWVADGETVLAFADGEVTGIKGEVIAGTITITLVNAEFANVGNGTNVLSWITNPPLGITAVTASDPDGTSEATITIGGTPTQWGAGTFTFTIPKGKLDPSNADITIASGDSGATWNILANPPLVLEDGTYTIAGTPSTDAEGTLGGSTFTIHATSSAITIGDASKKKTWTPDNEGFDDVKALWDILQVDDEFTVSSEVVTVVTLNTEPAATPVDLINDLFTNGLGVTVNYTDAELGGVTVPAGKTLTLGSAVVQGNPAVVSSDVLDISASGAALAGSAGYIKTNGGTITYGSLSGLTVPASGGAVADNVAGAIADLKSSFDSIAAAAAVGNPTVVDLKSKTGGSVVDPVLLTTNVPTIDSGVTLNGAGLTVALEAGNALYDTGKFDEVTLGLNGAGTALQVDGTTISGNTPSEAQATPVTVEFIFKLAKAGVNSASITLPVDITVDGE